MGAGMAGFLQKGWRRFGHDPRLAEWVSAVRPAAEAAVREPENAPWLRCGGTWFAGVNALPNDATGAVPGGPALQGRAVEAAQGLYGALPWDRGQVSVVYPGYPRQQDESDAAFGFRLRRDGAHVDGLKRAGPGGRRFPGEAHAFILGIALGDAGAGASPLVVWEGSHRMMAAALSGALAGKPARDWPGTDVTGVYQAARRRVFERCARVEVAARPGEAYLIHRHALHGISPWTGDQQAGPEGRMVAYFRPPLADPADWLALP